MVEIPLPVLILQHPQEPSRKDSEVSSARIITETLSLSHIRTGLSWKNLPHALRGWKALESLPDLHQPSLWHTLYLGTQSKARVNPASDPGIYYLDKKGEPIEAPESAEIAGLILLDGTWAQAKTLWWRNAWLTKTRRIYIVPKSKSLYGNLRKEPRPECVSTAEALAETLEFLGLGTEAGPLLRERFKAALDAYRSR